VIARILYNTVLCILYYVYIKELSATVSLTFLTNFKILNILTIEI